MARRPSYLSGVMPWPCAGHPSFKNTKALSEPGGLLRPWGQRQPKESPMSQKITPFLWFDGNAEEAAHYYVSIFKNSKITDIAHYTGTEPGPKGTVMTIGFVLDGQKFAGINGGPLFKFTEAVSFAVRCKDQAEIDAMWEKLSAGGEKGPCG
jgi:uncharacterized glyoxalase superfamily protein PhnB